MEDNERITTAKNNVGPGFGPGKDIPHALATKETSVYRVTGMDQIQDIINCGYVRPKGYGSRSERVGDKIYWSIGGKNLYYHDRRPVLEAPIDSVKDGQIGAIPLDTLTGIWMYDENQDKYINGIQLVRDYYIQTHMIEENHGRKR